ncbi:hypothetical protein [Alsobacter sp. SYSU BS001988]
MNAFLDFTRKAHESKRIGFGDLRRLQRDILPTGVATPREAELLLALDGALARADKGWTDFLAEAVSSFALGRAAMGLDEETAAWLQRAASAARPATAAAVLKRVRRDAAARGGRRDAGIRPAAAEPSEAVRPGWEWLASGYQVEVRPAGRNGAREELLPVE